MIEVEPHRGDLALVGSELLSHLLDLHGLLLHEQLRLCVLLFSGLKHRLQISHLRQARVLALAQVFDLLAQLVVTGLELLDGVLEMVRLLGHLVLQ